MSDEKRSFKDKLSAFWDAVKRYSKRVWEYLKEAKMEYIVMISLFALDLISKAIINATIEVGDTVVVIPYFINFHNIHNYNAAFGASWLTDLLGALGSRLVYCMFAVAVTVVLIIILVRHKGGNKLFRACLAMLAAGAMGNCIDRWALGYVRDFVEFVYFGLTIGGRTSFYVFNMADAELVVGVILTVVYFIFIYKDKDDDKKSLMADNEAAVRELAGEVNAENTGESEEAPADTVPDTESAAPEDAPDTPETGDGEPQSGGGGEN